MTSAQRKVAGVGALIIGLGAGIVFVASVISTSSASVSASTQSQSFFSAGTIALESATSRRQFLFDATGLFPGDTRTGCVEIDYLGSIPGTVRIFAEPEATTGLDRYIELELDVVTSGLGCGDTADTRPAFSGTLEDFWRTHESYGSGLSVGTTVESGTRLAVRASIELVDDNAAQGLMTDFSMILEVRP